MKFTAGFELIRKDLQEIFVGRAVLPPYVQIFRKIRLR